MTHDLHLVPPTCRPWRRLASWRAIASQPSARTGTTCVQLDPVRSARASAAGAAGAPRARPSGSGLRRLGGRPPPSQTSTSNLAQLCRLRHRVKTHGGWTYQLTRATVFTWTSPLGRSHTVDENGTLPLR